MPERSSLHQAANLAPTVPRRARAHLEGYDRSPVSWLPGTACVRSARGVPGYSCGAASASDRLPGHFRFPLSRIRCNFTRRKHAPLIHPTSNRVKPRQQVVDSGSRRPRKRSSIGAEVECSGRPEVSSTYVRNSAEPKPIAIVPTIAHIVLCVYICIIIDLNCIFILSLRLLTDFSLKASAYWSVKSRGAISRQISSPPSASGGYDE